MERQGLMKKNLAVILALVMIFTMFIPAATGRAYAAQDAVVSIDGKSLNDGTNDVGGGTAVFNKAEGTLTLKDVKSENGLLIVCQEKKFTVTVEGTTSIGSKDAQISGAAIWSDTPELAIIIAEGASTPFMRITEIWIYREKELLQLMLQANTRLFAPVWVFL